MYTSMQFTPFFCLQVCLPYLVPPIVFAHVQHVHYLIHMHLDTYIQFAILYLCCRFWLPCFCFVFFCCACSHMYNICIISYTCKFVRLYTLPFRVWFSLFDCHIIARVCTRTTYAVSHTHVKWYVYSCCPLVLFLHCSLALVFLSARVFAHLQHMHYLIYMLI